MLTPGPGRLPLLSSALAAFLLGAATLTSLAASPSGRPALPTVKRARTALAGVKHPSGPVVEGTLLDEVGKLRREVARGEGERWKRALHQPPASRGPEETGRLHLWLGEYLLAHEKDHEGAQWHFRQVLRAGAASDRRHTRGKGAFNTALAQLAGRAAYDTAISRFFQGAYRDATKRFRALLDPKTRRAGYSARECALWQRHAVACWGYHEKRAAAGITEPERIDPFCAAASLARCLRALGLRYDRPFLKRVCRVTGEGSSLQDVLDAAGKLGLSAQCVTLDEAGMRAVPKPLVVHVEHDHFIAVLRADERGVTYGCSDCGGWPGGEREVTWEQWRLMEPGACALVYRRGSGEDAAVRAAMEGGSKRGGEDKRTSGGGVRLAALPAVRGPLFGQLAALTALLKGHVFRCIQTGSTICGSHPEGQHCEPWIECCVECMAESAVANGAAALLTAMAGPSVGDPVNLATLEEEYTPPTDLQVYNPTGPSVSWSRMYNSLRGVDDAYEAEDFGLGWSHPYNVVFYDPGARLNYQLTAGSPGMQPVPYDGTEAPGTGLTWDIVRAGSTVATNSSPSGWSVSAGTYASIAVPSGATAAQNYEVRISSGYGVYHSAYFDVISSGQAPRGTKVTHPTNGTNAPGTGVTWDVRLSGTVIATSAAPSGWAVSGAYGGSGNQISVTVPMSAALSTSYEARVSSIGSRTFSVVAHHHTPRTSTKYVVWPNGSRTGFTASSVPTSGSPTVVCTPTSSGVPVRLVWNYSSTEPLGYYTLTGKDRSVMTSTVPAKNVGAGVYFLLGSVQDRLGNGISLEYGGIAGRHLGGPSQSTYAQITSGFPLLSAIKDGSGTNLVTFTRATDGTGNLTAVNDRYSRSVYYHDSYFAGNNLGGQPLQGYQEVDQVSLVVATGTGSPPVRFTYGYTNVDIAHATEEVPFLTSITVPSPTGAGTATSTLEYSTGGYLAARVDGNGNRREYSAPAADVTQVTVKNSAGTTVQTWSTSFNSDMTPAQRTDGTNSNVTSAKLYSDTNSPHSPSSVKDGNDREWTYTYDVYGNVLTATSPKGTQTTYTYDYNVFPLGRLTSVQEGSKTPTSFSYYEPGGLLYQVSTPDPGTSGGGTVTTTFTYDSLGNVLTITTPGNNAASTKTVTFNYTTDGTYSQSAAIGQPLTATDPLSHVTHFRYDSRGNTTAVIDALGIETDLAYNLADQTTTVTLPATGENGMGNSYTLNTYQYVGGPLASVNIYDESGTLKRTVSYTYGLEGETLAVTGSTEPVGYTFDAVYRLKSLTDGNSHSTNYAYNTAGYLSQITYPGTDTVSYTSYDDAGNLLQRVDGRGIYTNYSYTDADGLLTGISYPAYTSQNVSMSYDSYGRLSSMSDATGSHSYSYDDLDALTSETTTYTGLAGKTVSYGFYDDGSRASMTGATGSFAYYYDAAGRMTSVTNPYSETTAWTYLNNDWLKTQQLSNNATSTYTYDALARLTDLVTRAGPNPTDTLLSSFTGMLHDGAGNRTYMSATIPAHTAYSGNTSYTYDSKDQLTQELSTRAGGYTNNFSYDTAGNPTSFKGTSHSFNSNSQDTGNSYDGNGNPTTYGGTTCTYDVENRMTAYGSALTATYRGDGLRAKTVTSAGTTYFLYDGEDLLAEMNGSGTLTAVNTWGPAGLVSRATSSGSVFYTYDPQGSVVQRLDSMGAVLSNHVFDTYGTGSNSSPGDCYGYCAQWGYYGDSATGLYSLAHRTYDPATGRFLTRDPVSFAGGINLYEYCRNRPTMEMDPSGTIPGKLASRSVLGVAILGTAWLVKRDWDVWRETQDLNKQRRDTDRRTAEMERELEQMKERNKTRSPECARRTYRVRVRCDVHPLRGTPGKSYQIDAEGEGRSPGEAFRNARRNANAQVPPGWQMRHCHTLP